MQSLMPVHTHGIDQWGSNPYDGVDLVTQWYFPLFPSASGQCSLIDNRGLMVSGIPPGEIFNYWPNLGGQVGTYCMIR